MPRPGWATCWLAPDTYRYRREGVRDRTTMALFCAGLALLSIGCTNDPKIHDDATVPAGVPPDQVEAFSDGTVDRDEYHAAFVRFWDCSRSVDAPLANVQTDPVSGLIGYGVIGDLSAPGPSNGTALDDCYQRYFSWIEAEWQTTDPGVDDLVMRQNMEFFRQVIQPCLEANDVEIPDIVIPGTELFGELSKQFTNLNAAGLCPARELSG